MIERRLIRVLTVNGKTMYFVDKGVPRGTALDYGRLFEQELNKKLAAEKKLKNKNLKVQVVFIPVQRDQLLPALAAGKGDIAAASLTITPERRKLVDFTAAGMTNVSEVVVSGPASPKITSLDDLSGKTVFCAQVVELLRKPRCSQQETCCGKETARRRQQAHGGFLETGVSAYRRA